MTDRISLDHPEQVRRAVALHPGGAETDLPVTVAAGRAEVEMPMVRGCAVVRLHAGDGK